MSFFSKIEIKPEMESFISKGKGVGIVKVDGYGKASARIESYKVILESYKDDYPIIESISAITFLSYDPGNFFQEPKLVIGLGKKEYTLAGVDDNDDELEAFYKTILDLKNNEKKQKINSKQDEVEIKDKGNDTFDELDEVEEELDTKKSKNDTASKIKGFLSKRFDESGNKSVVSQENTINDKNNQSDDLELILDEAEESSEEEINTDTQQEIQKPSQEKTEAQKIEDMEEFDEFDEFDDDFEVDEEIILEDNLEDEELIIEEEDDGEELFIDDEMDEEVIADDELVIDDEVDEEVTDVNPKEITTEEELPQEKSTIEKSDNEKEANEPDAEVDEQKITENTKEQSTSNSSVNVANNNKSELQEEISQVKEQVNDNINNINQEISNQQSASKEEESIFDPVYQIRRYHELKEDGIITEEEFEMKKKQLLEL